MLIFSECQEAVIDRDITYPTRSSEVKRERTASRNKRWKTPFKGTMKDQSDLNLIQMRVIGDI